jgi:uncharacterized repeat protein (TIGR03803 family)
LHTFCSNYNGYTCLDGASPYAGLSYAGASSGPYNGLAALYGTTDGGGAGDGGTWGFGTVFKLTSFSSSWTETVLHSFCEAGGACDDGFAAGEGVIVDSSSSNVYGTATLGGYPNDKGVVFQMGTDGSNFTNIYNFCALSGCADGSYPSASISFGSGGTIVGTTTGGGNASGVGVVFKLTPLSVTQNCQPFWCETYPYQFCSQSGCTDGSTPSAGLALARDSSGNLWGTTVNGGSANCYGGCGIVFKLNPGTGSLTIKHSFTGGADGAYPQGGLIIDSSGNLYGTTSTGGCAPSYNCGTVFEFTP